MRVPANRLESLASPAFIAALALLVLNDFALKPLFHNALTGKLSDFAGLFSLTLFATTLWPRQRGLAAALIAGAFAFWKTSYAEPLIEWLNAVSPFLIGRTVDLTDLVALPVIPLAAWAAPQLRAWPWPKLAQLGLAGIALVAFTATQRARYVVRDAMDVTRVAVVDEVALQELFDGVAREQGLRCEVCVPVADRRVYVPVADSDVRALIVDLDERQTLSFTVTGYDRRRGVRSLARHVRRAIDERMPGIAVIDTTADVGGVVDGETTVLTIRVPSVASVAAAKQALSSTVAEVAEAHGFEADAASGHYLRLGAYRGLAHGGFVLAADLDDGAVLLVRLTSRWSNARELHGVVKDDLAARLRAQFGAGNVVVHHVSPPPFEWAY
jgi:hypothetical protein